MPVTVPSRTGDHVVDDRRAPPRRHHDGVARRSCARSWRQLDPERHRDRRQRQRSERRRVAVHRDHPREGRRTRSDARSVTLVSLGGRRRRAQDHGHRPGAGHREGARPGRPHAVRHRPHRAQRGIRRAGARGDAGVEVHRGRSSSGSTSTARASRSATRSAPPAAGCSATLARELRPPRRPLRPGDHVHRRRSGPGRGLRAGRHEPARRRLTASRRSRRLVG